MPHDVEPRCPALPTQVAKCGADELACKPDKVIPSLDLRVSVRKLSDQRRSLPTSVGACYRISSWCAPSVPRRRSSCSRDRDNSTPSRSGLRGTGPDGLERHATATLCANLERNRDLAGQAVPDPYDNYVALYNKRYRELCLISRNFCASHTDFTTELPEGDDLGETP
jgi:hypothetical protein